MKRNKAEINVATDIDETLILSRKPKKGDRLVKLIDPYDGKVRTFVVHRPHVKLIKDYHARGYQVTAWSANGEAWAYVVISALGLQDYVYETRSKFVKFVDDLQASEVLGSRVFIPYE